MGQQLLLLLLLLGMLELSVVDLDLRGGCGRSELEFLLVLKEEMGGLGLVLKTELVLEGLDCQCVVSLYSG